MSRKINRRDFLKTTSLAAIPLATSSPLYAQNPNNNSQKKDDTLFSEKSLLFKKVYGALIGAAIGDAMGGPVEFWHHKKIIETYGIVDKLMPYDIEPNDHGPWKKDAGTYTDDTRLSKLFCQAVLDANEVPTDKDLAKAIINYYHSAPEGLPKRWVEEYYLKAIYREDKQIFGGQPTNAGIMAIAPFGVINPCDPNKALADAYNAIFVVEGYARYSAAMAAAAIAAAMKPSASVEKIIQDTINAAKAHKQKVEGTRWPANSLYQHVGLKNEKLIQTGIEIANKHGNPYSLRDELLENISQQFGPDGSETLAVAITMFYAAKGDYTETIKGAVNFGRDNDSAASVAGAIAGAYNGLDKIPPEWIELVEKVNDKPTFKQIAKSICNILIERHSHQKELSKHIQHLIET